METLRDEIRRKVGSVLFDGKQKAQVRRGQMFVVFTNEGDGVFSVVVRAKKGKISNGLARLAHGVVLGFPIMINCDVRVKVRTSELWECHYERS